MGLLASFVLFVYQYSSTQIIKLELTGDACTSNVLRDYVSKNILKKNRNKIHVFLLQSYIFFGNSASLYRRLKYLFEVEKVLRKYIIFDFEKVDGVDASAVDVIVNASLLCKEYGCALLISSASLPVTQQFEKRKKAESKFDYLLFDDFDFALEHCEEDILYNNKEQIADQTQEQYAHVIPSLAKNQEVIKQLNHLYVKAGEVILKENFESDCFYFLESGKILVYREGEGQKKTRLKAITGGTMIGELGFFLGINRSASIEAIEDSVLIRFDFDTLNLLKEKHPGVLADLYFDMMKISSIRFWELSELVRQLKK